MKRVITLLFILSLFPGMAAIPLRAIAQEQTEEHPVPGNVIITEIKLGESRPTTEEPIRQFVTIFNQSEQEIDLSTWRLEYIKEGFAGTCDQATSWADDPAGQETTFSEKILAPGSVLSIERPLNDTGSGSLRIAEISTPNESTVHDLVGWGKAAPCAEGNAASSPAKGESIHRYLDCENTLPVDTGNNGEDFFVSQEPSYSKLGGAPVETCEVPEDPEEPPVVELPEDPLTCEGIVISEILPNAAGSDQGKEFIELYNPTTDFILLDGCGLAVDNSKAYWFEAGIELAPEEYLAFYDSQTDLTLPNSAGGTVYVLLPDETETHQVTYGPDLDDDVSWIWVEDELWEQSYSPTPSAMNTRQPLKPCPEGQERNADTNRCNAIITEESELKPCEPNEERNPQTNRCRDVQSASTLKPCDPGEERNPATNRCRKIGGTSSLKPCGEGQERNPETNRCRKVAGASTGANSNIQDIQASQEGSPYRWWIAGGAVAAVLGYAVFEWRRDIAELWRKHIAKTGGK